MHNTIPVFLNLFKPPGMTSHDVVAQVRKHTGIKRVGHGGTLDPMACGVLPIALNRACRLLRFLPDTKTYLAEILLGTTSDTDDITGTITQTLPVIADTAQITAALTQFNETFKQVPPAYSAVHVDGKRSYELARSGQAKQLPARLVTVFRLDLIQVQLPVLKLRIICSGGFYVRSLARDLGHKLGCGGCLKSLLREQAGNFRVEDAISLEQLATAAQENSLSKLFIPAAVALPFEQLNLSQPEARALIQGQKIRCNTSAVSPHSLDSTVKVSKSLASNHSKTQDLPLLLALHNDEPIALCRQTADGELLPEVVLADPF